MSDAPSLVAGGDARIKHRSRCREAMIRPAFGGNVGAIVVFTLLAVSAFDSGMVNSRGIMTRNRIWTRVTIIAVGIRVLMIAGAFNLLVGSMIGLSGRMIAIFGVTLGWPVWLAILVALARALTICGLTDFFVMRTGLASFIVSLAFLFILRGFAVLPPLLIERKATIGGIRDAVEGDGLAALFCGTIRAGLFRWSGEIGVIETFVRGDHDGKPVVDSVSILFVWTAILIVFGHVLLTWTKFGHWNHASGGDAQAAFRA